MRNVNAIKQSRVIQEMSTRLRDFSDKGGFASVLVSTYFAPTRSLAICNAGHPPPLMFRAQENTWSVLKRVQNTDSANDNASPGVLSEDEFQEFSTHLSDGDMVLCYSNSLTECRDANGRTMGVVGLLERVRKVAVEHPSDIVGELTRTIQDEHLDNFCEQDATIILSRASTIRVGLKNNLLAPFRLLCRVSDNTHLGWVLSIQECLRVIRANLFRKSFGIVVNLSTATTVQGQDIAIKVVDGKVMINNAKVVNADVKCKNGVIHIIDTVILPK
jgi:sigma-B regulation protein RsbU (phosphoserine phosphatase)